MRIAFLISCFCWTFLFSDEVLLADPDIVSSGLEFNKTVQLMLGEELTFKGFTLSGLIHVRNEERFNKGLFPNHNWRGVITINYNTDSLFKALPFSILLGLKHESAHPTMGICCTEDNFYEKVYDSQYRRYLLNSVDLSLKKIIELNKINLLFNFNYHFYFYSKNTPELLGMQSTQSNGFSGGLELRFNIIQNHYLFLSIFDRIILDGLDDAYDKVHFNIDNDSLVSYPIVNSVNSIKSKLGITFNLKKIKRKLNIYSSLLHGNIYGFVDSREKRRLITFIGIEFVH